MSSDKKSLELQHRVRHNAEEYRNQLNDLYSWEKEIKDKEQQLQYAPTANNAAYDAKSPPVRSHAVAPENVSKTNVKTVTNENSGNKQNAHQQASVKVNSPPTEKVHILINDNERHKEANDIKDRGNNFVKLAQYEKAIEAYTAAIDVYAKDPIYYCNRALCYLKLERYDECIEDCECAIEIDKLCVKAYYRRMQANEFLGNNMDALKDCTTVLTIEPKNVEGKKSLQRINDRLRRKADSSKGPNFSAERTDLVDILPIEKLPYKRSKQPMLRVPIVDIVGPKANHEETNTLCISDEDIDKLFNSNCGPFEEVKKPLNSATIEAVEIPKIETKIGKNTMVIEDANNNISPSQNQIVASETAEAHTKKLSTKKAANVVTIESNRPLPPPPKSTAQFYTNWKELSSYQKYQYLKSIEISNLCRILGAGFDSETLTDILNTLHEYYLPNKEPTTTATLLEISKNSQLSILAMLMSSDEKKVISEIVNTLRDAASSEAAMLSAIANNFGLY